MTAVDGKPDTSFREQTRTIVRDCLLRSNSATKGDDTATFVATCVADVQTRNHDEFDQMCFQLDTSPTSVQPRVVQIFHETFHNGINWGRVIAFLAFMKHFSADCEKRQLYGAVESICEWSGDLITSQLEPWIRAEGGWVAIKKAIDVKTKQQQSQQQQQQQQLFDANNFMSFVNRGIRAAYRAVTSVY